METIYIKNLSPELKAALQKLAKEKSLTLSAYVRLILQNHVKKGRKLEA